MWIRNARWDTFWILSGVPLGMAFLACTKWGGIHPQAIVLWMVLLTQTGHLLSPMALAWSHDGFRQVMWRQPTKYVMMPVAILVGATIIAYGSSFYLQNVHFNPTSFSLSAGPTTLAEFKNPFMAMVVIYSLWNAYHFGMQAFGVMSIYRKKNEKFNGSDPDPAQRRGSSGALPVAPARPPNGPHGAILRGQERNVLGNLFASLSHHRGPADALPTARAAQRKIDMVYCCGVTWATMLVPFVPRIAKEAHDLTGWPAHPHPFLDRVWVAYAVVAGVAMAAMLWRERCLPRVLFILTDGLGMVLTFWFGLWGFAIVAMNHWLVAIGLSSHVYANHRGGSPAAFALGLMATGMVIFCVMFVNVRILPVTGFSTDALYFTVTGVGCRLGLGFVHFLYDRWIYKLRDPQVRATIGRNLFCLASISCASSTPLKLHE